MSTSLNDAGNGASAGDSQRLLRIEDLADGVVVAAEAIVDGTAQALIVHRDGAQVRAWWNVCPHAGRRLDWSPGQFLRSRDGLLVCAVHGASFELEQGRCVAGPCLGDRLREVAVCVDGGWLVLAGD